MNEHPENFERAPDKGKIVYWQNEGQGKQGKDGKK